jgi:transcriptional regulator with XRE-family HTH domain
MNKQGGLKRRPNRLWVARKRRGLEQKQVAYLLGQPGIDQISHYEQGSRLPSLTTALRLEVIYGLPVRLLFKDLYTQVEDETWQKISINSRLHRIYGNRAAAEKELSEYCAFLELLNAPSASEADRTQVRRHVTVLAKKLAYL